VRCAVCGPGARSWTHGHSGGSYTGGQSARRGTSSRGRSSAAVTTRARSAPPLEPRGPGRAASAWRARRTALVERRVPRRRDRRPRTKAVDGPRLRALPAHGIRLAEVGFRLVPIAGAWPVAAEIPEPKLPRTRTVVGASRSPACSSWSPTDGATSATSDGRSAAPGGAASTDRRSRKRPLSPQPCEALEPPMGTRGRRPTVSTGPGRAKGMGTTRGRPVRCLVLARAAGSGSRPGAARLYLFHLGSVTRRALALRGTIDRHLRPDEPASPA
jgi:hypothetical protein